MKLLRNKSLVLVLAIVAVGLVTKNTILTLFHSEQPSSLIESYEEIEPQMEEDIQFRKSIGNKSASIADFKNIGWAHDYSRDPFKPQAIVEASRESTEKTDTPVVLDKEELPPPDVLIAVVHDSGNALAVINDVIVGEGDYYYGHKVIKIGLDSVKLEGPDGDKTLEF